MPEDFFVGYLPTPPRHRRLLRWLVPVWLIGVVGAGAILAGLRRDPGRGVWNDGTTIECVGTLLLEPAPMLILSEPMGECPEGSVVLLVEPGKHGAQTRARPHAGHHVRVRGTLLARDQRQLIELAESTGAIEAAPGTPASITDEPLGTATLSGEIVDSKCFLGAMKPGDARPHKECAMLCIAGGIPPMLISRTASGSSTYTLLGDHTGAPIGDAVLPWVGEPVTVTGTRLRRGDLFVLRVAPGGIQSPDARSPTSSR